jgi:hypothetical protein
LERLFKERAVTDTIRMLALSGLAYEDEAPLGWKTLATLPEGVELNQLNAQNARLLQADASIEEHRGTLEPKDETQPLVQEIHRLEFKLDIVLRLMSNLLERQHGVPQRRKFRIYAQGLEWSEAAPQLSIGERGLVSLHLNRALPYPIELPGEIVAVHPMDEQMTLRMEFRGLSVQVTELIEKLIFRHHRRQVAEARQSR